MTYKESIHMTAPKIQKAILENAERMKRMAPMLIRGVGDAGEILLGAIKNNLHGKTRVLELANSWQRTTPEIVEAGADSGRVQCEVYSMHPFAPLREYGGTVTAGKNPAKAGPRKGQLTLALWVPIMAGTKAKAAPVATAKHAGARSDYEQKARDLGSRGSAATWEKKLGGAQAKPGKKYSYHEREYGDRLAFIPRKGKPPLLAIAYKNKIEPVAVLMKSVKIGPHPYVAPAIASTKAERDSAMSEAVEKALTETANG